jgi:hypothetical protein
MSPQLEKEQLEDQQKINSMYESLDKTAKDPFELLTD